MALARALNERKYGLAARSVNELINQLTAMNWYSRAGQYSLEIEGKLAQFMRSLGVHTYEIKWIEKEQLSETIASLSFENSALWEVLKELPDKLKKKIEGTGREQLLEDVVDNIPEAVFHRAYEQAYRLVTDVNTVKFLVGHAMYISLLVCIAELAGEKDSLSMVVEILEEGHLPLGPKGNTFYLL